MFCKSINRDVAAPYYEEGIKKNTDEEVFEGLKLCIDWGWEQGILICEREITRRGLNQQEPKERFIL